MASESTVTTVMRPRFQLTLSKSLVELLMKLSSVHYDRRCREAGQIGGFLYGWRNHFVVFDMDVPVETDSHELDTLLKIMEGAPHLQPDDRDRIKVLGDQIREQLRASRVWS